MELPNFEVWAKSLLYGKKDYRISDALRQAYEQGYQVGLNQGWAIEQDKEHDGD